MVDWLQNLPVTWMAFVMLGRVYLSAGVIYWTVATLAVGERAHAFKDISPSMLSPLGTIFALLVAFVAAEVWSDFDRAKTALNREASALRALILQRKARVDQRNRRGCRIGRPLEWVNRLALWGGI
jgi:hypothetical protein